MIIWFLIFKRTAITVFYSSGTIFLSPLQSTTTWIYLRLLNCTLKYGYKGTFYLLLAFPTKILFNVKLSADWMLLGTLAHTSWQIPWTILASLKSSVSERSWWGEDGVLDNKAILSLPLTLSLYTAGFKFSRCSQKLECQSLNWLWSSTKKLRNFINFIQAYF